MSWRLAWEKVEFNHQVSFSPNGSGVCTGFDFLARLRIWCRVRISCRFNRVRLVESARSLIWTSDAEIYFTDRSYTSRFRGGYIAVSAESETTVCPSRINY